MSHDDIQHHVKTYIKVFMALMFFTLLTVYASYVDFDLAPGIKAGAIFVGLFIAIVKGALVATQFMHLNNEKPLIYMILSMTVVFFLVLFFMPTLWHNDGLGSYSPENIPMQNGEILKETDHSHHNHGDH